MKQKIKIPIRNVIFKKENIIELAECIFMQENKLSANCTINFKNGQEIESDDISIFEHRKFQEYEINFINMSYWEKNLGKYIEIYIYNYDTNGLSSASIMSNDSDWLAIVEKNIREKLSFCDMPERTKSFFSKAYPKVEISISDKNNSSKKKRNNIMLITTTLILPIVLNLIYDFIKMFIR